jgi:hypothetical protein
VRRFEREAGILSGSTDGAFPSSFLTPAKATGREFVMRTYFDGPDALITENHFIWRTDPVRAFIINDLRDVRLVQRDVGSPRVILLTATVAAVALIVAPGWLLLHTTVGRLVLLGAAVAAVSLATIGRRSAHQWELRAAYQSREVVLYTTLEIRTFNQVTRALRRAIEGSGRTRQRHPMAAA